MIMPRSLLKRDKGRSGRQRISGILNCELSSGWSIFVVVKNVTEI
jgi:hypothetical protein